MNTEGKILLLKEHKILPRKSLICFFCYILNLSLQLMYISLILNSPSL